MANLCGNNLLEMVETILEAKGKYFKPFLETSLYTIYNCKSSVAELYIATISQYNKSEINFIS